MSLSRCLLCFSAVRCSLFSMFSPISPLPLHEVRMWLPGQWFCSHVGEEFSPTWLAFCLLVACLLACLKSQQHATISQGRICSDKFTCCHNEIEVADQAFYLTQSEYTDTGPTSPSTDPIIPGSWQGSHWSANF